MITARRGVVLLVVVVLAIAVAFLLEPYLSVEYLVTRELELRRHVEAHPLLAFGLGLIVYWVASLIPGTAGKAVIFGWVFGFLPGLLIVNVALTAAAVTTFLLSRYVLAGFVRRRFARAIVFIDLLLRRGRGTMLLTLRLVHAPYSLTNYALGTTRVPLVDFWWTTQLGILPGNVALVYVGASLPSLHELVERGIWELISPPVLAGLVVFSVVPLVVRLLVGRFLPGDSVRRTKELLQSARRRETASDDGSAAVRSGSGKEPS